MAAYAEYGMAQQAFHSGRIRDGVYEDKEYHMIFNRFIFKLVHCACF